MALSVRSWPKADMSLSAVSKVNSCLRVRSCDGLGCAGAAATSLNDGPRARFRARPKEADWDRWSLGGIIEVSERSLRFKAIIEMASNLGLESLERHLRFQACYADPPGLRSSCIWGEHYTVLRGQVV